MYYTFRTDSELNGDAFDHPKTPLPAACSCSESDSPASSHSNANTLKEIDESVNEAYRRLVLNTPSLLPSCDMPVARFLFAEWIAEQYAQRGQS